MMNILVQPTMWRFPEFPIIPQCPNFFISQFLNVRLPLSHSPTSHWAYYQIQSFTTWSNWNLFCDPVYSRFDNKIKLKLQHNFCCWMHQKNWVSHDRPFLRNLKTRLAGVRDILPRSKFALTPGIKRNLSKVRKSRNLRKSNIVLSSKQKIILWYICALVEG